MLGQEVALERELRQAAAEVQVVGVGEGAVVDVDQRVVERARRGGDRGRRLADVGGDGRDHFRARAEQVGGQAAQVRVGDEVSVAHLMNSCWSSRR